MRSPHAPGYVPRTLPTPAWLGGPSDDPVHVVGGVEGLYGLTITDQHFARTPEHAIYLRECHQLVIERCTFWDTYPGQPSPYYQRAISMQVCDSVLIRDCAFYDCRGGAVLLNECSNVTIEDCWIINPDPTAEVGDILNAYLSQNVTVRWCMLWGGGTNQSAAGIILGDGDDATTGGGDGHLAEDNVLIDCNIAMIGTNGTARRNAILNRGLSPSRDGMSGGILAGRSPSYPTNPAGPFTIEHNDVQWFKSTGMLGSVVEYDQAIAPVAGIHTNPVNALVDEFSRFDLTGYYGSP